MSATATLQGSLSLAEHVRACRSDGVVILLDLRRNRYLGIDGRLQPLLARFVEGWPDDPRADESPPEATELERAVDLLLSKGLLVRQPCTTVATPAQVDEATGTLDLDDERLAPTLGMRRASRIVTSSARAAVWLRFRSPLSIARAVAAKRERLAGHGDDRGPSDAVSGAVAAFVRLRPMLFTAQDRCLHDSLSLIDFLGREGLAARWVIGVEARPFGAHSWVQSGNVVLNDQHERVRRFRPILVV